MALHTIETERDRRTFKVKFDIKPKEEIFPPLPHTGMFSKH